MFNGVEVPVADQLKYFYDVWGTDKTYNHMAVPWTWAFDTPFKWTKQVASHFGGTRQGMAIILAEGASRTRAASATSSTMSSTSCRRSSRRPAFGSRRSSTASRRARSKA